MAAKLDKPMSSPALKVFFDKKYTPEEKDEHTQDVKKPTTEGYMKILQIVQVPDDIMCCQFSSDGTELAIGMVNGTVQVLNALTGRTLHNLVTEDTDSYTLRPVTQVKYIQNPQQGELLIAAYASGCVKIWTCATWECVSTIEEDRQTLAVGLHPNGKRFVTAGASSNIYVYDTETNKKVNTCKAGDSSSKMDGHRLHVFAAQYNPNHRHMFITGGWDNTVQYWDERQEHAVQYVKPCLRQCLSKTLCTENSSYTQSCIAVNERKDLFYLTTHSTHCKYGYMASDICKIFGPHICGDALDVNPATDQIFTGSWRKENALQIWDFVSGDKVREFPQDEKHTTKVYSAQFLGKHSIFYGGSSNNLAGIIDVRTRVMRGQLYNLPQGVFAIDNDRVGKTPKLAICSGHSIYFVEI